MLKVDTSPFLVVRLDISIYIYIDIHIYDNVPSSLLHTVVT